MLVGVLGLQGSVIEHVRMLERILGPEDIKIVKKPSELMEIDRLIIPGGESTTIRKLMKHEMREEIKNKKIPIFGTCTGAILLANEVLGEPHVLGLMDIQIKRNAYGRQKESFEIDLEIPGIGEEPFRGVFIRAPIIKKVGSRAEILAECNGDPVLVKQGNCLAATFHPELTEDMRLHKLFLDI